MAAVMLQTIPSFYTNYSKNSLFIAANTYEKFIVSKENSIARHDDKMCFLANCRGVIILMSCNPLSDARMSLLCFQVVRFRDNSRTSF